MNDIVNDPHLHGAGPGHQGLIITDGKLYFNYQYGCPLLPGVPLAAEVGAVLNIICEGDPRWHRPCKLLFDTGKMADHNREGMMKQPGNWRYRVTDREYSKESQEEGWEVEGKEHEEGLEQEEGPEIYVCCCECPAARRGEPPCQCVKARDSSTPNALHCNDISEEGAEDKEYFEARLFPNTLLLKMEPRRKTMFMLIHCALRPLASGEQLLQH